LDPVGGQGAGVFGDQGVDLRRPRLPLIVGLFQ